MSDNIVKLRDINKIEEEGSQWLSNLDRGLSDDEEDQLKAWLSQSTEHQEYFVELAKQWDDLSVLSQLKDIIPYNKKAERSKHAMFLKAASFALFFILGAIFFNGTILLDSTNKATNNKLVFFQTYKTAVGEKSTIHLPDASVLTLNTDSLVKINFTDKTRAITLEKGEAHIKVAHNKARRLILSAGEKSFVAVGTAFNVQYSNKSKVELIVTEGKVAITDLTHAEEENMFTSFANSDQMLLVNAGNKITINSNEKLSTDLIKNANGNDLAWREGVLVFNGETLAEVIQEMSRYSNIDVEFKDEHLKYIRIGGRFTTDDINGLLDVLNQQFEIKSSRLNKSRIQLSQNNNT